MRRMGPLHVLATDMAAREVQSKLKAFANFAKASATNGEALACWFG